MGTALVVILFILGTATLIAGTVVFVWLWQDMQRERKRIEASSQRKRNVRK